MESVKEIIQIIEKYDSIAFYELKNDFIYIHSNSIKIKTETFRSVLKELKQKGYIAKLQPYGELSTQYVYVIFKSYQVGQKFLNTLFLSLISLSVTIVSLYYNSAFIIYNNLTSSAIFIAGILIFLIFHSIGHLLAEKKYQIMHSFPIFLPAPLYGTYGLVARIREIFVDRIQTFDFALYGIIFALIPTVFSALLGINLSSIVPKANVENLNNPFPLPLFLYLVFEYLVPSGYIYLVHPLFVASIVCFLLLFIDLAPVTQLDGGFMAASFIGARRYFIYLASLVSLIAFIASQLYFMAFLALYLSLFFRFEPLNVVSELDKKRKILFAVMMVIWILITPAFNSEKYSLLK